MPINRYSPIFPNVENWTGGGRGRGEKGGGDFDGIEKEFGADDSEKSRLRSCARTADLAAIIHRRVSTERHVLITQWVSVVPIAHSKELYDDAADAIGYERWVICETS